MDKLLFTCYRYLVGKTTHPLLKFTFVIGITLVGILLYMHGSFYGDIMAKVDGKYGYTIMWHVMCEGKPPKDYM